MSAFWKPDHVDNKRDAHTCKITEHEAKEKWCGFAIQANASGAEDGEFGKPGDEDGEDALVGRIGGGGYKADGM